MYSFNSYSDKAEKIHEAFTEAFLLNKQGKPDFYGHAKAHESWVEEAAENKKMRQDIFRTVLGAMTIAVGAWLWAVIVPALRGGV